ncbi:MAG: hypothetical protein ACXWCZ_02010 [Flavisolibacter sp.]
MKKPLLIICCLISFYGWSQPTKESVLIEINTLKTTRYDLENRIETLKSVIIYEMLAEEKLRSSIDKMIVQMDSLTRIKLRLQRKKQLTAQEQEHMKKLNKLMDANSNKVQDVDLEITTIINTRRDVIQELQKNIDSVHMLNSRIRELEGIK